MSAKHTPGNWELSQSNHWPWIYTIKAGDTMVLSYHLWSYSTADTWEQVNACPANAECHANARLMAAAPELLGALQSLLTAYQTMHGVGDLEMQPAIFFARKCIAAATGETA